MGQTCIEVRNASRTYHVGDVDVDVDVHALRDVSLTMERGEFVAVMGSSGSGKSTLMAILGCLDRPDTGSYCFGGTDISLLSEPELATIRSERLGFVFHSFNLLARTSAIDNVALPLFYSGSSVTDSTERTARASAMLELLGLADRENNTPCTALWRPAAAGGDRTRTDQFATHPAG